MPISVNPKNRMLLEQAVAKVKKWLNSPEGKGARFGATSFGTQQMLAYVSKQLKADGVPHQTHESVNDVPQGHSYWKP